MDVDSTTINDISDDSSATLDHKAKKVMVSRKRAIKKRRARRANQTLASDKIVGKSEAKEEKSDQSSEGMRSGQHTSKRLTHTKVMVTKLRTSHFTASIKVLVLRPVTSAMGARKAGHC